MTTRIPPNITQGKRNRLPRASHFVFEVDEGKNYYDVYVIKLGDYHQDLQVFVGAPEAAGNGWWYNPFECFNVEGFKDLTHEEQDAEIARQALMVFREEFDANDSTADVCVDMREAVAKDLALLKTRSPDGSPAPSTQEVTVAS